MPGPAPGAELEHLRQSFAPPPRADDILAVLDKEISARRAEQEAGPLLLARLNSIAARLRQPVVRRRYVEPDSSPPTHSPARPAPKLTSGHARAEQRGELRPLPRQVLRRAQRTVLG